MTLPATQRRRRAGGFGLARFCRDTRAVAGVYAALVGAMVFGGTALVSDHVLLVHNRDILQGAAAAAGVAATQQLAKLDPALTDAAVATALEPMVRRYVLANLLGNLPQAKRQRARDTLALTINPDRDAGVVGVRAEADLGGAIVGHHFWGAIADKTKAASGGERVVPPVDVALAIDVTGSMNNSIYRGQGRFFPEENRRINVVRNAARNLIRALYDQEGGDAGHVSVALVPFNTTVNVGPTRQDWVSDLGQGHKVIPAGFGAWSGCIEHRPHGANDLDLSLETPADQPFTSWFYPSTLTYRPAERAALRAQLGRPVRGESDWSAANPHLNYKHSPHYGCPRDAIIPLTTNRQTVERAIDGIQPWGGGGTMTHLGVVWGRRVLATEWRSAWGLTNRPSTHKFLVLLTDGINDAYDPNGTYPGNYRHGPVRRAQYTSEYTGYGRSGTGTIAEGYRVGTRLTGLTSDSADRSALDEIFKQACDLAKADGITVFTVSAVPRGHPQERSLRRRLRECASATDHAFTENSDPARMETAFRQIGRMVHGVRRTRVALW